MTRIYLSPPHLSGDELPLVQQVFDSNWIAPLGPQVVAFERDMCQTVGVEHATALSSGTAALHLALIALGVEAGDEVWCSTLTFAASANAIRYVGAIPVFIDAARDTWCLDPELLTEGLEAAHARGRLPKAVIVVDLYGQCADYDSIVEVCERFGVAVIEDAAESLGSTYRDRAAGAMGQIAVLSFNGNKIITTSGGGMLLSRDKRHTDKALFLATQARDPAPHYEHSHVGYNYRMSNVLAAIGRGQLSVLASRVAARRRNFAWYNETLRTIPSLEFMPEASYGSCNRWLTCLTFRPDELSFSPAQAVQHFEKSDIEVRQVWKPMHLQPVYRECRVLGGKVAEDLFARGLCLPSGSSLTESDLTRVVETFGTLVAGG